MAALTQGRPTPERDGRDFGFEVAAGATIYLGALVGLDAMGKAVAASPAAKVVVGVARNPAVSGEEVATMRGTFLFENSAGGEALARTDIGAKAYVADDQTVKKTAGSPAAPAAGVVMDVDADGVWVKI